MRRLAAAAFGAVLGQRVRSVVPAFPQFQHDPGDRYRQVEPYLDSLRRIRALEPELLITGHFAPIRGHELIRACLDRLEAAVDYVHVRTLAGMNAGRDAFTLMREIELPDELYVGQGYGKVSWAVRTIWETYMGWFKARASSELYATQPVAAAADLVELAGIDRVVELGRTSLAGRDCERAMLLAEAALAHDASHRDALRLALDANRALLERSGAATSGNGLAGDADPHARAGSGRTGGGGVSNQARYDYRGARVLVTGGTSGIGAGIAAAYRDAGGTSRSPAPAPARADSTAIYRYRYLLCS